MTVEYWADYWDAHLVFHWADTMELPMGLEMVSQLAGYLALHWDQLSDSDWVVVTVEYWADYWDTHLVFHWADTMELSMGLEMVSQLAGYLALHWDQLSDSDWVHYWVMLMELS